MLPIKRVVLERFVFILLLLIISFITANRVRTTDEYHSSLAGVIESIRHSPRDVSYVNIQFRGTQKINMLSGIKSQQLVENKNLLIKGDSIFKPMFTKDYYVYRKNNGKYEFVYKISSIK